MNISALEACRRDLYTDRDTLMTIYPAATVERVVRIRGMHQWMVDNPATKDRAFVEEAIMRYGVSEQTAYSDLRIIKELLPTLSESSRAFNLWKYNEMILETYDKAKEKDDYKAMERAATSFARVNNVGKEEELEVPIEKLIPQHYVPTVDPRVLGMAPIPNIDARIREMIDKYSREVIDITDIDVEDADLLDDEFTAPTLSAGDD